MTEAAPLPGDDDPVKKMAAIASGVQILTGKSSPAEALAEIGRWRQAQLDMQAREARLAAERAVLEATERRELVTQLVRSGFETPATAWADQACTQPRGHLSTMSIADLRERVRMLTGTVSPMLQTPTPKRDGVVTTSGRLELSEFELGRLRARIDENKLLGRTIEEAAAVRKYVALKHSQVAGAADQRKLQELYSRPVSEKSVLLNVDKSSLAYLAGGTPIQPIQEFGAASQRALEEFRLEYNVSLASQPRTWAEEYGTLLPGGSLKDTYPLSFRSLKYIERSAQSSAAKTAQSVDITVQKRRFGCSAQVELQRLVKGDFAYILAWGKNAADMAFQRVYLRNDLVTTLLEAGTSGYWGYSSTLTTGIDGQPFFSASHKVNPFDASVKYRTSATWGNYQASATPLNAANLTAEKNSYLGIPAPDGRELNCDPTGIIVPTCLDQTANNLLTVQDIILDAKATLNGVSNAMGNVRNPHFNSGFEYVRAPELAGTDTTANYYMVSKAAAQRGIYPWVIAEDAAEELRVWDETSDFYKDGQGFIKVESLVMVNACLLFPHAIRYIKGA